MWFRLVPGALELFAETLLWLDQVLPDELLEFASTADRTVAWQSSFGRWLAWLFCGTPPEGRWWRRQAPMGQAFDDTRAVILTR